jgi:uncharacterized protein YjbI with pentapeptide repeats
MLIWTHLERADLGEAHLENATLGSTQLQGASLWKAHLEGADFVFARLHGANLSGASGLSEFGFDNEGDAKTKLPAGFTRPADWPPAEPDNV